VYNSGAAAGAAAAANPVAIYMGKNIIFVRRRGRR